MSIKLNEVTWYSKLGAVILFLGVLPTVTFYIGMKYENITRERPSNSSEINDLGKKNSKSTNFEIIYDNPECSTKYKSECDQALIAINSVTHRKTTLIPSFNKILSDFQSYGPVALILQSEKELYFAALERHDGSGVGYPRKFFIFNLIDKKIIPVPYPPGIVGCEAISPDNQYIANYYQDIKNKKSNDIRLPGGELKVYNIVLQKFVFSKKLNSDQAFYNGVQDGMFCSGSYGWRDGDKTSDYSLSDNSLKKHTLNIFEYTIYPYSEDYGEQMQTDEGIVEFPSVTGFMPVDISPPMPY